MDVPNAFEDPEYFMIPEDHVLAWLETASDRPVPAVLTRNDWDHLFFCFTQLQRSQAWFQSAAVALSSGSPEEANSFLLRATEQMRYSETNFRKFFSAIMRNAVQEQVGP
jgi:hypothetical protein